jgi:hypothetical protein
MKLKKNGEWICAIHLMVRLLTTKAVFQSEICVIYCCTEVDFSSSDPFSLVTRNLMIVPYSTISRKGRCRPDRPSYYQSHSLVEATYLT